MSYSSTVLADSPIRYYRLGESSGTSAADAGSQAQNGTYAGGFTLAQSSLIPTDASNTAVKFNGSTGKVTLPTTGLPTAAASWTMEAWVMWTTLPTGATNNAILSFGTAATNKMAELFFRGSSGKFSVESWTTVIVASSVVVANTAYHVVATYDGTTVILYLNGVSQGSAAFAYNVTASLADIAVDTTAFASAVIDEVAIYSTTLTSGQIQAHYNAATTVSLSATIPGVGTLAGTLSLATALTATIAGQGVLAATLTLSGVALSGTMAGIGTLSATFSLSTALSATLAGVGTITGTLTLKTALAATLPGVGTITGTLSLATALTGTLAGVGTLAATLTVSVVYNDYKTTIEPNLIAALSAANLLNNVQVLGTDTTSASDTTWLLPASIDLALSLDGYVRHAFPPNATDISNDSREVAVKSLIGTIYTNDPTSKPIIQGEMGFGYAGPGQSVTLYQYGVDMADYAVQLARAGMAALLAYDLDDDMHGTEWGFWQITTDTGQPRPWFFPWSLLCNTLVIGSTLYAPAQPASNDFRMLAATSPQGFWTVVLINRKSIAQNVQVIVPFAPVVTTTMQIFTYSQATPLLVDSNGFPLASGSLSVVLQRGFTTSIAANSVLVLTQNAPASTAPPPVGAGLPPQPPIGATTINTYDVKRPPLEKRR